MPCAASAREEVGERLVVGRAAAARSPPGRGRRRGARCRRRRGSRARRRCTRRSPGCRAPASPRRSASDTAADMPSKPGKPGWPNGSTIGLPSRSVSGTRRRLAGQQRIDRLRAEEALEAGVAARLAGQQVGLRRARAARRALRAVDREADEVGLRLGARRRARGSRGRRLRLRELRRAGAEHLGHVADGAECRCSRGRCWRCATAPTSQPARV